MTYRPTWTRARICAVLSVLLALLATSCSRHQLAGGVSDSTFVAVMAGLRRLPAHSMIDSASRMAARDSILRHYGLTVAQLESAAVSLASSPARAAAVWDAVTRKENSPQDVGGTVPKTDTAK